MCLDKAVLAWGGRAEDTSLGSWLSVQGPVIVLHVINSKTEVFLTSVQNDVCMSGARDTAFQKV